MKNGTSPQEYRNMWDCKRDFPQSRILFAKVDMDHGAMLWFIYHLTHACL